MKANKNIKSADSINIRFSLSSLKSNVCKVFIGLVVILLMIVSFFIGGTTIPLFSCYNDGCGFEVKQSEGMYAGKQCGRVFYSLRVFEKCDGVYISNGLPWEKDKFMLREDSYLKFDASVIKEYPYYQTYEYKNEQLRKKYYEEQRRMGCSHTMAACIN